MADNYCNHQMVWSVWHDDFSSNVIHVLLECELFPSDVVRQHSVSEADH